MQTVTTTERDAWELGQWDAVETAERIRRRDVSAREVVEAAIVRANDRASLNAIVTNTFDRARKEASEAAHGALFGVPTAIKDLANVAGVRTALGTAASGEWIAKRSSPIARAMHDIGLVSIGKSATPELGMTGTTEPIAFGPCRNPHDPEHSTGGSSGGASALVAARVVPIAHASDGGGSIRIPASCCGLVGLKPSRGRMDMDGSRLLPVNIAVDGVVTRTVRDTVAFWNAVAPLGPVRSSPARRLKIAVFVDSPVGTRVDPEIVATVERTAAKLRELGHDVRPIACPYPAQVVHDFIRYWAFVGFAQARLGRLLVHPRFDAAKLEPFTHGFARHFTSNVRATLLAIARLRRFTAEYESIVGPWDVLVGPTLGELPPRLGHLATHQDFDLLIERLLSFTPFTGLINAAGAPALTMPMGKSASGLPIGVQLQAGRGSERVLLELGGELEAAV